MQGGLGRGNGEAEIDVAASTECRREKECCHGEVVPVRAVEFDDDGTSGTRCQVRHPNRDQITGRTYRGRLQHLALALLVPLLTIQQTTCHRNAIRSCPNIRHNPYGLGSAACLTVCVLPAAVFLVCERHTVSRAASVWCVPESGGEQPKDSFTPEPESEPEPELQHSDVLPCRSAALVLKEDRSTPMRSWDAQQRNMKLGVNCRRRPGDGPRFANRRFPVPPKSRRWWDGRRQ